MICICNGPNSSSKRVAVSALRLAAGAGLPIDADVAQIEDSVDVECRITLHAWEGLFLRERPVR
jgi:hypothetical protein